MPNCICLKNAALVCCHGAACSRLAINPAEAEILFDKRKLHVYLYIESLCKAQPKDPRPYQSPDEELSAATK